MCRVGAESALSPPQDSVLDPQSSLSPKGLLEAARVTPLGGAFKKLLHFGPFVDLAPGELACCFMRWYDTVTAVSAGMATGVACLVL